MSLRPALRVLAVAAALAAAGTARGQDAPPGTPAPSRGAPGDKPGRGDPFGTEGGKALVERTPAERDAGAARLVVERIEVAGAERTSASEVKDHLVFHDGDVLTPEAIVESRVRLVQLGTFSRVDVFTAPGARPGRVVVRVELVERAPVTVTDVFLGQTAVARPYGGLGLADASVTPLGIGIAASVAADGEGRRAARLTLYEPDVRFRNRSYVAGLRLLWTDGRESGCATVRCDGDFGAIPWLRYRRVGGQLDFGFRPGAFSRFVVGWRFEGIDASFDKGAVPATHALLHDGRSRVSALALAFDVDSRTDTFLPQDGWRFQSDAVIATAALGSDYDYDRFLVQAERWLPQGRGRALRLDAALGLVQGDAPVFDRFYQADWSYFSVGLAAPRLLDVNFSPDPRYDVLLLVGGAEYDFPLWRRPGRLLSRGFLAVGLRAVFTAATASAARSVLSESPVSLDLGVRMDTRFGVFGIGLGYAVDQVLKAVDLRVPGIERR